MRLWVLLSLLYSPLVCISFVQAGDNSTLSWKWEKEKKLTYLFKHREIRTVEVGDLKFETTSTAEWDFGWKITNVDKAGTADIQCQIGSLKVNISGKDFDFQYDSSQGNQGATDYHKRLIGLLDQFRFTGSYRLRIDPTGKILEAKGFSKVLEDNNPGLNIIDFHGLNWKDDSMTWFLQQVLGRLPEPPQAHSQTWNLKTEHPLTDMGAIVSVLDFTRDKIKKEGKTSLQEISWKGTHQSEMDMKWINAALKGTLKTTTLSGTMQWDWTNRAIESSRVRMEIQGNLNIGNGQMRLTYQHELDLERKK